MNGNQGQLVDLLKRSGETWAISDGDGSAMRIRRILDEVRQSAQHRLGDAAPGFDENWLTRLHEQSPHKFKAFIQAVHATSSPDMLVMAWRILQGMEIQEADMSYRGNEGFHLRVVLVSPYGEQDAPYETDDIYAAALLSHWAILKMDGKPVFDGFYPLVSSKE